MLMRPTYRAGNEPLPFLALFGLAPSGVYTACLSPDTRCALTAPFHPYHSLTCFGGMFLLHFPYSYLRRTLSGTLALWSPDFPHESLRFTQLPSLPNKLYYIHIYSFVKGLIIILDGIISNFSPISLYSFSVILITKLFSVP